MDTEAYAVPNPNGNGSYFAYTIEENARILDDKIYILDENAVRDPATNNFLSGDQVVSDVLLD